MKDGLCGKHGFSWKLGSMQPGGKESRDGMFERQCWGVELFDEWT